ncbi:hypothetical protein ACFFH2_02555 [Enterococcus devriesei]|uniref:hypothetical protein n=1 Tax=Enterococcus devriesei TaxID=319970 RepID=UPI0008FFE0A8|nr:hypothetical protein [Enterococcus devriesei]
MYVDTFYEMLDGTINKNVEYIKVNSIYNEKVPYKCAVQSIIRKSNGIDYGNQQLIFFDNLIPSKKRVKID